MQLLLSIVAILLFISLILIHEWGHYIAARRAGVDVEEFGLGLPPRAFGRRLKSGLLLSINWLPIGGFVKLKGEHDSSTEKGSFGSVSLWSKSKIMLAGVTMNLLTGIFLLTVVAWIGTPKLIDNQFSVASDSKITHQEVRADTVQEGSPAASAGLQRRDIVVSLSSSGQVYIIKTSDQLMQATKSLAGQPAELTYIRNGETIKRDIMLRSTSEVEASKKTDTPKGHLGIVPVNLEVARSTWSAPIVAVGFTGQLIKLTAQGLWTAVSGLGSLIAGAVTGNSVARQNGQAQATDQVGGPLAIVSILWGSGDLGINFVLWIIAIISLTLAIMNILPIPALDGGRLAMILFSRKVLKKPLSKSSEEKITGIGMAFLLLLIVLITIVDIRRFY